MKRIRRFAPLLLAAVLPMLFAGKALAAEGMQIEETRPAAAGSQQAKGGQAASADVAWQGTVFYSVRLTLRVTVAPRDSAGAAVADPGAPIPGAVVQSGCLPPGGGLTGSDGKLTVTGLAPEASQTFTVSAAGYEPGGLAGFQPGKCPGYAVTVSLVRIAAAPSPSPSGAPAGTPSPSPSGVPAGTPSPSPSRAPAGAPSPSPSPVLPPGPGGPQEPGVPPEGAAPEKPGGQETPLGPGAPAQGAPEPDGRLLWLLLLPPLCLLALWALLARGCRVAVLDPEGRRVENAELSGAQLERYRRCGKGKYRLYFYKEAQKDGRACAVTVRVRGWAPAQTQIDPSRRRQRRSVRLERPPAGEGGPADTTQ